MIEKPKRPKKIPNQDNKQPQTIRELIRRYDLDNTKIYDFLDELVGTLKETQTVVSATEPTGDNREKVWMQQGSLYNSKNNTKGYYLDSLGAETANGAWDLTEYMQVKPNESYERSGVTVVGTAPYCAYYDSNKNFISSFKNSNGIITMPTNACYVRFSINGADVTVFSFKICPRIYVKNDNDIYEEFINANKDEHTYKTGDTFSSIYGIFVGGTLTGGSKVIAFSIFTPKSLKNISKLTINSMKITVRDVSGNYLLSSVTDKNFDGNITIEKKTDNCISILLEAKTAFNATNNTPVAVSLDSSDITLT